MSEWPSVKARRVLAALLRIGWSVKRHKGTSHRVLERPGFHDYIYAFHDDVTLGPAMVKRIARDTGLRLEDL